MPKHLKILNKGSIVFSFMCYELWNNIYSNIQSRGYLPTIEGNYNWMSLWCDEEFNKSFNIFIIFNKYFNICLWRKHIGIILL